MWLESVNPCVNKLGAMGIAIRYLLNGMSLLELELVARELCNTTWYESWVIDLH